LDAYTEECIQAAVAEIPGALRAHIVYAFETLDTHGRCVSVATVAHVAGLAYFDPGLERSIHPTFGPWIAYRAVVVFSGLSAPLLTEPAPLHSPLPPSESQRVYGIQRDCFEKWHETDERTNWQRLRGIVEAFAFGYEYR